MEVEANKRINRYKQYASNMKVQFEEYEKQSEKYYSEMLERFKQ